jgi:hypothetical protein
VHDIKKKWRYDATEIHTPPWVFRVVRSRADISALFFHFLPLTKSRFCDSGEYQILNVDATCG